MIHKMKLQPTPFNSIKSGRKTVEMRLNDEKRQQIKIGDEIEFTNMVTNEIIFAQVQGLRLFKGFKELYAFYDKALLGYLENQVADPYDMSQYYSIEEMEKYGALAIEISLTSK